MFDKKHLLNYKEHISRLTEKYVLKVLSVSWCSNCYIRLVTALLEYLDLDTIKIFAQYCRVKCDFSCCFLFDQHP